jgi:hypothetical protein
MRIARMQRRVRAWSAAIPGESRNERRQRKREPEKEPDTGSIEGIKYRLVMVTLTYADEDAWQPRQVTQFIQTVHRNLKEQLLGYAWVCEMQERGAPHYHVLLYFPRGTRVPKPDEAGWWKHGSTRIETAKSPHYITSYTGKEYQKVGLPKGARMFAVWLRRDAVSEKIYFGFRISAAPAWLTKHLKIAAKKAGFGIRWVRVKGGGWRIVETKTFVESEWEVISIQGIGDDEWWMDYDEYWE